VAFLFYGRIPGRSPVRGSPDFIGAYLFSRWYWIRILWGQRLGYTTLDNKKMRPIRTPLIPQNPSIPLNHQRFRKKTSLLTSFRLDFPALFSYIFRAIVSRAPASVGSYSRRAGAFFCVYTDPTIILNNFGMNIRVGTVLCHSIYWKLFESHRHHSNN
jgi:hypothetical protein